MSSSVHLLVLLALARNAVALAGGAVWQQPQHQQPLTSQPHQSTDENAGSLYGSELPFALEAYIEDVMERWHSPGLAVSIVNGTETWAKGFGLATLEPPTDVTPETLFFTGSTTKSFTAASLSLLIDNSSDYEFIRWDTPVSHLLREDFVLSDDWATAHITIEDALCHRTGYPRHDLSVAKDVVNLVRSLRHLPMSAEPRTKFQYNNMMFATAGHLITTLTGLDLGTFFRRHLWLPMGMHSTFLGPYDPHLPGSGLPQADGYWWVPNERSDEDDDDNNNSTEAGSYVRMPTPDVRGDEGAGAVMSNVLDYARYLRVMMAEAGPVSRAGHHELKRPRTFHDMHADLFVGPVTYGLGWMSGVLANELVYFHTGTISTFETFMAMVPSRGWAVTVLANSNTKARELVMYRALYDLLGVEEERRVDFEPKFEEADRAARRAIATCVEGEYPGIPSPPIPATAPLVNHTGQYTHPAYDSIVISLKCDDEGKAEEGGAASVAVDEEGECRLVLARGPESQMQFGGNLVHVTGDFWVAYTFMLETPGKVDGCVRTEFRVGATGSVTHIGVDLREEEDDAALVWFERAGL